MNEHESKYIVCPRCDGQGCIPHATGDKRLYEYKICNECGGYGMMIKTIIIKYKKLNDHPTLTLKLDNNGPKQAQDDRPDVDP